MSKRTLLLLPLIAALALSACGKKTETEVAIDSLGSEAQIEKKETPMPEQSATELKKEDTVVGTGKEATSGALVTVHYKGTFLDGKVFDTSLQPGRDPFTFQLGAGQVIEGWDQGVAGMKVGGTRMLTIPSDLAYGPMGSGPIPPNTTLLFEVQLLDVK